jgi:hypothetical protein
LLFNGGNQRDGLKTAIKCAKFVTCHKSCT